VSKDARGDRRHLDAGDQAHAPVALRARRCPKCCLQISDTNFRRSVTPPPFNPFIERLPLAGPSAVRSLCRYFRTAPANFG
jgi:hypothetical protein